MFSSVVIRRTIATPRPATLLASTQMHPRRSDLHTLLANTFVREFDVVDGVNMRANFDGHDVLIISLLNCFINPGNVYGDTECGFSLLNL